MRLVMVDSDKWFVQSERDSLRGFETNNERVRQARPLRGGNGVKLLGRNFSLAQRRFSDGNQIPQMFARGEFGNDSAIFGVQFSLRGNGIGQNLSIAHDGNAGLVAGSFNG